MYLYITRRFITTSKSLSFIILKLNTHTHTHTDLLADHLPLAVEVVKLFLDVHGKQRLRLLLQVQAHLVDTVEAGLDGVDVIHQGLAIQNTARTEEGY